MSFFDTLPPLKQAAIGKKAMELLYTLTPGGSEFVCEPERCHAFVKDRLDSLWKRVVDLTKEGKGGA